MFRIYRGCIIEFFAGENEEDNYTWACFVTVGKDGESDSDLCSSEFLGDNFRTIDHAYFAAIQFIEINLLVGTF